MIELSDIGRLKDCKTGCTLAIASIAEELIPLADLLNEQDQKIKELEQELFSTKVEKLDDRLAEYGGPDDEEVWQKEFGMSSREAKKKAGWWV